MNVNSEKAESGYPLFSIGVTTYNRIDLLKQTLLSLINQDFADFEIIIGNDFLDEQLTSEIIGIFDSRIKIINNEKNLGELDNMNSLLLHAKGRYFSWIFDDDLCAPNFLSEVRSSLIRYEYPLCVLTSYEYFYGTSEFAPPPKKSSNAILLSGKDFLRKYLSGNLRTISLGGFHEINYLRSIGGAPRLSKAHMALYSEYLILIREGLVSRIAYINSPLNIVRVHNRSWSQYLQLDYFMEAGRNLVKEAIGIFSDSTLNEDFRKNLTSLLKSVICVVVVNGKTKYEKVNYEKINKYISLIKEDFKLIEDPILYKQSIDSLNKTHSSIQFFILKAKLKSLIPNKYMKVIHYLQKIFSGLTNKSF